MFDEMIDDALAGEDVIDVLVIMRPETIRMFHACQAEHGLLDAVHRCMRRAKWNDWVFLLDLVVDPESGVVYGRRIQRGCVKLAPRQSACICAGCMQPLGRDARRIDVQHERLQFCVSAPYHDRPACARWAQQCVEFFVQTIASHRQPAPQS